MAFHTVLETTKIRHLRLDDPLVVAPGDSLAGVIRQMAESGCACACVVEDSVLRGIFTARDVLTKVVGRSGASESTVGEVMTREPITLGPEATVDDAIHQMSRGGYRHLPVVDDEGYFVTCVSGMQVLALITEHFPSDVRNLPPRVGQKMTSPEGA